MSFGLRAFKKEQEHELTDGKHIYVKNLIVGESTPSLLALLKLSRNESSTKILTSKKINVESVLKDLETSPEFLRGNIDNFRAKFEAYSIGEKSPTPMFYKDAEFKKFGGRSKPLSLMEGEDYFLQDYYAFNEKSLFSDEDLIELGKLLENNQIHTSIVEIEKTNPTDLAEPTNYKIHLSDYEVIECENLVWTRSPKEFLKLSVDKDHYSSEFHEFVSKIRHRSILKIRLEMDSKISDFSQTVLVPQSVTHEWGHFICEFYEGQKEGTQNLNVFCFVDGNEVTSEDLAKKVKLVKRVLERIWDKLKKVNYTETIAYVENAMTFDIDDELYFSIKDENEKLNFVGESSPIEPQFHRENFLTRSLISLNEI